MMETGTSTLANGAPLWGNLKTSIDGVSAFEECLMLEQDDPRRLAWALEGTRLGLWDWDMVSGQTIFNERWAEIIGYRLEELEPTTIDTWIAYSHPDDLEVSNAGISACITGEAEFYDAKVRMRHRDGHWVWVRDRGRIVERADDGTPLRMVGTHQDVTEDVEQQLRLEEARSVFENSLEGIVILDENELILSANPAFTAITHWPLDQIIGVSFDDIRTHSSDPSETEHLRGLARSEEGLRIQRDFLRPDGTHIPMLLSINRVLGQKGEITRFVAQLSDLRDRIRVEQDRLDRAMSTDQATGLPNRHSLLTQLDRRMGTLQATNSSRALLLLSFDLFQEIHDAFGHEAMELVATITADRLRAHLLASDLLARPSRETFAVVMGEFLSREDVRQKAQGLLSAVQEPCQVPSAGNLYLTGNIGIVFIPEDVESADQALQQAAAALSVARTHGPGYIEFHDQGFVLESQERVIRSAQLREGWAEAQFRLEYQPLYDIGSGALVGVEALMRWSSPELGAVSPGEFIPLAESSGLIVDMGNWAIAEACRQGSHWGSQGLDLSVSVNVSAHNLMAEGFLDTIAQALRETHFKADRLILELTESTLINASGQVIELLAQLESMGIRIAIDDFGTGYSSFAYLRQFPLDRLKIDKSFVDDIEEDSNARSIVAAIIDLGHHLNLQVLAEGVETPGQLEALQELGCDLYQGFLSSPAIAPDAVKELALQL